jgi:pSer/pThr/pTyr-binding forkhead associated (FHA) protein
MKKVCDSCGKENHERAKFCTSCGKGLASVATPMPGPSPLVEAPSASSPKPTPMRAPKPLMPPEASKPMAPPVAHSAPTMFADGGLNNSAPRPLTTPVPFSSGKEAPLTSSASLPTMFAPPEDAPAPRGTSGGVAAFKPEASSVKPGEKLVVRAALPIKTPKPANYDPSAATPAMPAPTPRPVISRNDPAAMTLPANDDPNETPAQVETLPSPDEAASTPPMPNPAPIRALAPDTTPCPRCATPIQVGFIFCGRCGFDMRTHTPSAPLVDDVATPESQKGPVPDLVLLTPDGQESNRFTLAFGDITVGRSDTSDIPCPENFFLSEQHSIFSWDGQRLLLRDLQSFNGTFIKLKEEVPLSNNDCLCIGQQFLRFELCEIVPSPSQANDGTYRHGAPLPGMGARLILIGMGGLEFDTYYLRNDETTVGRVSGDIIFSKDNFISRAHAKITARDGVFYLSDLGSSNGTFLQIRGEIELGEGELLLMGDQLFRIEMPR